MSVDVFDILMFGAASFLSGGIIVYLLGVEE